MTPAAGKRALARASRGSGSDVTRYGAVTRTVIFSTTTSPDKDDPAVTVRDNMITRAESGAGEWGGAAGVGSAACGLGDPAGWLAVCGLAWSPPEHAATSCADASAAPIQPAPGLDGTLPLAPAPQSLSRGKSTT